MPDLLAQSPPRVRRVFEHAWAPMQALARELTCLPHGLWGYLLGLPCGFAAITAGRTRYVPGPVTIRHRPLRNVAFVSVEDLAEENEKPLHVIGHLLDHHLGCGGEPEGPWLSSGTGLVRPWQEAGARLPRLFALGYGVDELARSNAADYFAQSLALYCRDRQRLNTADPQMDKWFRSTLWNEGFWKSVERQREE